MKTNFLELRKAEVQLRRIHLPRTWVNRGKEKGRGAATRSPGTLGTGQQFIHVRLTFWGRRGVANRLTKLYQERLQRPCRCIDKQDLALLCSCVSEGVHRRPGNVDHRAGTSIDLALAKDELELAFEDVVGFILAAVQVRRRCPFGRDLVLEDPHALALVMHFEGQKLIEYPQGLSLTLGNVDRSPFPCLLWWLHAISSLLVDPPRESTLASQPCHRNHDASK